VTHSSHKLAAYRPPGWRERAADVLWAVVAIAALVGLVYVALKAMGPRTAQVGWALARAAAVDPQDLPRASNANTGTPEASSQRGPLA
jgi:hypothetical protein